MIRVRKRVARLDPLTARNMPSFVRRTLFWKYAAYFSGLVSALLILSGGVSGYFAYRESTAALKALQRATAQVAASEIASFIGRLEDDLQSVATKFNTSGAVDGEDLRAELGRASCRERV